MKSSTSVSRSCSGSAVLFYIEQYQPCLLQSTILKKRLDPKDLNSEICYFMDCTNLALFPPKIRGVLCALVEDDKSFLGFILSSTTDR